MNIQINEQHCTGCSYCVLNCPESAIELIIDEHVWPVIDSAKCTECGECLYSCPNNVFDDPNLWSQPVPLKEQYDAVIIGAGIGGLMTGAGLAKAGKDVLILEQLSYIGGKYTHLNHQGYSISTAAWTCPGTNSRIGKLCNKLGADIDWITIQDTGDEDQKAGNQLFVIKDGPRFPSLDEAQEHIIGGKKAMKQVYAWMADMFNPNQTYPKEMTAREYIQKFVPDNTDYENYVQTIITYCFASQTVDNFSAMELKKAIVDSIDQMAEWGAARGGTKSIIQGIENVIRKHNGTIALRTRVENILLREGKAVGVKLADGREIHAEIIIHNAGLNRLKTLVGVNNLPEDYVKRLHTAIPANVGAVVLGTSEPLLGKKHSLLHTMGWEPTLNCYSPTYFDPGMAPKGKYILDVFWVMEPPYHVGQEVESVLQQLHEVFPNFDEVVEMQNPMFFTGTWTAEMARRIGQSGDDRPNPVTPIDQLYFVGYDAIGYGIAGDIIPHNVEHVLYHILKDATYAPEDEKFSKHFSHWLKSVVLRLVAFSQSLKKE